MSSMLDMSLDDIAAARRKAEKSAAPAVDDVTMDTLSTPADRASPPVSGKGGKASRNAGRAARAARRHTPYGGRGGGRGIGRGGRGTSRAPPIGLSRADDGCGRRIYVGNLSWEATWQNLKDHMKPSGEVLRADVLTGQDGRSKGCGIVEFSTVEGARRALSTMSDTELLDRKIFVREDREATGGAPLPHPSGGGATASQSRRVYVGNLSWEASWQDLKDHMRAAGEVLFAEVMMGPDGRSKGCGIVEYATAVQARDAISRLTDTEIGARKIFVREDREMPVGGAGPAGGFRGGAAPGFSGGAAPGFSGGPRTGGAGCNVYVGNLAFETAWQELKDHMRLAGNVDKADILHGGDGRSKGCAIVTYQRPQEAQRAIREMQNSVLHGRPIFVREDREALGGGGGRPNGRR